MSGTDYTHGEMDITEQKRTWEGFITFTLWMSGIVILITAHACFVLATGMNWLISLLICAALGIGGGVFMGMGTKWTAGVIALTILGVLIQIIVMLAG